MRAVIDGVLLIVTVFAVSGKENRDGEAQKTQEVG